MSIKSEPIYLSATNILDSIHAKAVILYPEMKDANITINISLNKNLRNVKNVNLGLAIKVMDTVYLIQLDLKLMEKYGNYYLDEVILHEYAHIVDWIINRIPKARKEIHGEKWKSIMYSLGAKRACATTKKFGTTKEIYDLHMG